VKNVRKWGLIVGLLLSGSLFFVSGILTGYSMYYGTRSETTSNEHKNRRKPRILREVADPLIGKVIDKGANAAKAGIMSLRAPSAAAIKHAQKYKSHLAEDDAE
jgi:hypothetical protein